MPELVPIRYGRMLVSPFAFFRGAAAIMAADLAATPALRLPRPALRRRAPVELRHLRNAGAEVRLRHQRLRRDARRPVGVGRQAARREPRGRGPRERVPTEAARRNRRRDRRTSTGRRCGRSRRSRASASGTAPRGRQADGRLRREFTARAARPGRGRHREGADEGQPASLLEADRDRRRRAPDHRRPAADRLDRAAPRRRGLAPDRRRDPGDGQRYRAHARRSTGATCSTSTGSSTSRARWSASAASAPAPGSRCFVGHDDVRPARAPGQGGPAVGARAVRRRQQVPNHGRADRDGPAADAGRRRPVPRLDAHRSRPRRRRSATTTSASSGTGREARRSRE